MSREDKIRKLTERYRREFERIPVVCGTFETEERMFRARDGAGLKTFFYRPEGMKHFPVLVQRSCYPDELPVARVCGEEFARRGFGYVFQFVRGKAGSEGRWEPNINEREDGQFLLQWLNEQDWVESIGYFGMSYLALAGWSMLDVLPDKVKAVYLSMYGPNRYETLYQDGMFRQDIFTAWAMMNGGTRINGEYLMACAYRPQVRMDRDVWNVDYPWYREVITSTEKGDLYWAQGFWKMLREMPEKIKIPVMIEEGWYDHQLENAKLGYESIRPEIRKNCRFRIGPWGHGKYCPVHAYPCNDSRCFEILPVYDWFDRILRKGQEPEGGVELYVIGQDRWLSKKDWPKQEHKMKLHFDMRNKKLLKNAPEQKESCFYVYDPQDPTPSYGAESCFYTQSAAGSLRQPEPGYRSDVISFISEALDEDVLALGKMKVELYVSSDAEDTAFSVKIMEVQAGGAAYNVRTSITSLAFRGHSEKRQTYAPGEVVKISLDTWDIAWLFHKGSLIRVDIASADFPQYHAHSNYPGIWALQEQQKCAQQTLYSGGDMDSVIQIPIFSEGDEQNHL